MATPLDVPRTLGTFFAPGGTWGKSLSTVVAILYERDGAVPNIDDYLPHQVEAIEVYRGAGESPAEFTGTGNFCDAVVIWSRVGGSQ